MIEMRFPDWSTLGEVAAMLGVPVDVVLHVCETHSLPDQLPESVVSQAVAERIARVIEGQGG